ncbi:hypothetical protein AMTRI_Chr04g248920 [Amborella trichopoda]
MTVPPSSLSPAGVASRDVVILPETNLSARLYLPQSQVSSTRKLPTIIYFHGGGFIMESPFSSTYQPYTDALSAKSNALIVSVNYSRAPENPLPAAYEDGWSALKWVVQRWDPWLRDHANLDRIYLVGDSSGANLGHHMAMKAGIESLGVRVHGLVLVHPYFWASDVSEEEAKSSDMAEKLWKFSCPMTVGLDDPWINPMADGVGALKRLGCERVLVCLAEKDCLRQRGRVYYEALKKCRWEGVAEIVETEGEDHCFHLFDPESGRAKDFIDQLVSFITRC